MFPKISKRVPLALTAVFFLTALLLYIFAFVAPVPILNTSLSFIIIFPSDTHNFGSKRSDVIVEELQGRRVPRAAALPNVFDSVFSRRSVDGPTIRLGALGSCAQRNKDSGLVCTKASLEPTYDLSFLPSNTPPSLPAFPISSTATTYLLSILFLSSFFIMHILITVLPGFSVVTPRVSDNKTAARVSAWVGILGLVMMLTTVLVWRMSYGRDVDEFNARIAQMDQSAPALAASVGNGFVMIWVALALSVPTLIWSLFAHPKPEDADAVDKA
ncbi:hypothetical protein BOTBODRAFT_57046 [Botryobasidium botryosum FD-172 SS1]|uniref:Uncharacterized protein n=1 Tax=Botryobasidium botryosum (strain FD-172 SS1) TaxID=930990 RepID=A0A067MB97_BOTB1|nr:hypothetical protein BOTBODRAFT_57046 [Botryobasidium botryosum FD-172 SS1]